ncbi:MAG: MEDS domain-containing protein [Nitrosopumilus sp.]|nr:MEDS domain-containing protein [Nitrosopumilus sp.]
MIIINPGKIINILSKDDTLTKLSRIDGGIHCMIIYPDLTTLKQFYSDFIKNQIEENNEIFLYNSFYETIDSVRQILAEDSSGLDISKYEKENTLVIGDSLKTYFGQESVISFIQRMINHAKEIQKNGITILSDMGVFSFKEKHNELVDFELSLPTKFDKMIKGFCLYHQKDFDILSEEQKQQLIHHHGMVIKIEA